MASRHLTTRAWRHYRLTDRLASLRLITTTISTNAPFSALPLSRGIAWSCRRVHTSGDGDGDRLTTTTTTSTSAPSSAPLVQRGIKWSCRRVHTSSDGRNKEGGRRVQAEASGSRIVQQLEERDGKSKRRRR